MARMAVEGGIEGVVCTPHWVLGKYDNKRSKILTALRELQCRLDEKGIPLKLYPGAELRLDVSLMEKLKDGELLSINDTGRYVLIELPQDSLPHNLDEFFWDLQAKAITPIISHPERNLVLLEDPQMLWRWVQMGVLTQLTAASLLGHFGKKIMQFSAFLLNHHLVHTLVTDAHGLGMRNPRLSEAGRVVNSMNGDGLMYRLLKENPERILHGQPVRFEEPIPIRTHGSGLASWKRLLPGFLRVFAILFIFSSLSACNGGSGPAIREIRPEEKISIGWNNKTHRFEVGPHKAFSQDQKSSNPGQEESVFHGVVQKIEIPDMAKTAAGEIIELRRHGLSPRGYMTEKFKGKRVVFPEELPPEPDRAPYRVGPEDELRVFVWQHPDLSLPVSVRSDGRISIPLVGELDVAGLEISQLESLLAKEYSAYLEKPNVTVTVVSANSLKVFITGAIRVTTTTLTGGLLPLGFPLRGDKRLLTALSLVEILPDADLSETYVVRGDMIIPLDLNRLIKDGDTTQNILLKPADTIVIPLRIKAVSIMGEVNTAGRLKVERRTTVLDALAQAGGVKRESAVLDMAYLARQGNILQINFKRLIDVGDLAQNILVEDRDIIYIPSSKQNVIYVLGEVRSPKVVRFTDSIDVMEAISEAGDFLTTANRSQVVVVRGGLHSPKVYAVDALQMMRGETHERFILDRYDIVYVPRTLIADWNVFVGQLLPTAVLALTVKSTVD